MNKEEMQKRLEAIESEAKSIREALDKKKQWKPQGGMLGIDRNGGIVNYACVPDKYTENGYMYRTKELAEKAAKIMRRHNRLLAYVLEHAPDWKPNWSKEYVYTVFYNQDDKKWKYIKFSYMDFTSEVSMPEHVAKKLVDKLNSREVVL